MRRALDWLTRARSVASSNALFAVMKLTAESLLDRRFQRHALRLLRAQSSGAAAIKLDVSLADIDREQSVTHQSIRPRLDHCRALGIEARATRIGSTRALEWACRVGFDQVQGFMFGKPDAVVRATQQSGLGRSRARLGPEPARQGFIIGN